MAIDAPAPQGQYSIEQAAKPALETRHNQTTFDPIELLKEYPGRKMSPDSPPLHHLRIVLPNSEPQQSVRPEPTRAPESDRSREISGATGAPDTPARIYEFKHLANRASDHGGADAIVRLPENFDPTKPIHLLVYNHGLRSSVRSSFSETKMNEQLKDAPPNTVLIMPEWQANPASESSNQGRFAEPGRFRAMLQEVFDKTPALAGKSLKDVADISITAHSAGNVPAQSEIYKNGLADKIKSITLFDALYNGGAFDRWIKDNINDLARGSKQFQNFYTTDGGTAGNSLSELVRVRAMLRQAGLPGDKLAHDDNGSRTMEVNELAQKSIVFKRTDLAVKGRGTHMNVPNLYINRVERAARLREQDN